MKHTLMTAAKATGLSKATIYRAIKSGKLSATIKDNGSYEIDPSELSRVFSIVSDSNSKKRKMEQSATPETTEMLQREINILQEERQREREQLARERKRLEETIDDLRSERDQWRIQATALLAYQPEKKIESENAVKKNSLFEKLFGTRKMKM